MSRYKKGVFIAVIVLGALSWFFVIAKIYKLENFRISNWRYRLGSHYHRPVGIADVSYIAPWMTFDYITKIFHLPPTYLKQDLKIEDVKYPFVTLAQYAKNAKISPATLIENTQNAVKSYLASSTLPQ